MIVAFFRHAIEIGQSSGRILADHAFTRMILSQCAGKVRLHFLPPYCPDENRIERVWLDLHANVTRNHTCKSIEELMKKVNSWLGTESTRQIKRFKKLDPYQLYALAA